MDDPAKRVVPMRGVLAALLALALLRATTAVGEVIDDIAIERHDSLARVRLRLTGPVHYIRQTISADGETASIYLQALAPGPFDARPVPDEVKHSRKSASVPGFTVRVSLDPRCDPAPNPICIVIRFDRAIRYEIRLGEDRRSLILDLPFASEGEGVSTVREKP